MTLLELKNVGFRYPLAKEPCLRRINLKVEEGEFVGITGRNGVGKTTLCNIIRRIIPEFIDGELRGEILYKGKPLSSYSRGELAKEIGFVFQNPFVQISGIKKTVYEEIGYSLENLGVERSEIKRRIDEIMNLLKIEHLKDKHPKKLSGGQSQLVALASVLIMKPRLLLVDEPTSQLDPVGTEMVFEALKIVKGTDTTVILVEHKVDLISEYVNRVVVLNEGMVVCDGPNNEVFSNLEIENYGVEVPSVTKLAYELKSKGYPIENIPTNLKDTEIEFRKVLKI